LGFSQVVAALREDLSTIAGHDALDRERPLRPALELVQRVRG
jgi:hypothetical protein